MVKVVISILLLYCVCHKLRCRIIVNSDVEDDDDSCYDDSCYDKIVEELSIKNISYLCLVICNHNQVS